MALWNAELSVTGVLSVISTPMFECVVNFKNLQLTFDIDTEDGQSIQVPTDSVTAQYSAEMDADVPQHKNQAFSMGTVDGGSAVSDPSFTVTRLTNLGIPPLEANDGGADQPPNSIVIDAQMMLGGMGTQTQAGPLQGSDTTQFSAPVRLVAQYDPRENVLSVAGATQPKNKGLVGQFKLKLSFNGTLEAHASTTDFTQNADVAKGHTYSNHPNRNCAVDTTGAIFLHGNVTVKPMVKGKDRSDTLTPMRIMRVWTWRLETIQDTTDARGLFLADSGWAEDNASGSKSWHDVPGIMTRLPLKNERSVLEFVWGAKNFPDFKPLYYIVVIDTMPGMYRVRVSKPETLSLDDLRKMEDAPAPHTNESTAKFDSDSGWLDSPASATPPSDPPAATDPEPTP